MERSFLLLPKKWELRFKHSFFFIFLQQTIILTALHCIIIQRRCNEQRGIYSGKDPNQKRKHKAAKGFASKNKNGEQHQSRGDGRVEGTGQGGVQRRVHFSFQRPARMYVRIFPNTVKNNHRIVQRVPNNGKYGRDKRLVYFHTKWHELIAY